MGKKNENGNEPEVPEVPEVSEVHDEQESEKVQSQAETMHSDEQRVDDEKVTNTWPPKPTS